MEWVDEAAAWAAVADVGWAAEAAAWQVPGPVKAAAGEWAGRWEPARAARSLTRAWGTERAAALASAKAALWAEVLCAARAAAVAWAGAGGKGPNRLR
jgi:hypothetical protein